MICSGPDQATKCAYTCIHYVELGRLQQNCGNPLATHWDGVLLFTCAVVLELALFSGFHHCSPMSATQCTVSRSTPKLHRVPTQWGGLGWLFAFAFGMDFNMRFNINFENADQTSPR